MSQACCPPRPDPPRARRFPIPGEFPASIAAGVLLALGWALRLTPSPGQDAGRIAIWASLLIGMVYGGRAALRALRASIFDIDVLMVVAAALAAVVGHPDDGALLLFLFVLAGALEDRAMARTRRAVEALHKLMPTEALAFRDGRWAEVDPQDLTPGERIRIRTGELIPADARVISGASSIDQATLTGESLPRSVTQGDDIYAGTLNLSNPIEAQVVRRAAESSLQKVLNLVTSAQEQREPIQQVIDRLSQPYAIGVFAVSAAVFLVWWLIIGQPLMTPDRQSGALYTAIALLIVGSPCALIIATPTATLAAISRAARAGLLFKGGQAIERLARLRSVALDKTGTLTQGRPRLHQVHPVAWSDGPEMLAVAAALEAGSTHPIATAVVEAARIRAVEPLHADDLQDIPGRGISGTVAGAPARLGTFEHCSELIPDCLRRRTSDILDKIRARGQLGVVVAWTSGGGTLDGEPGNGQAAILILSDTVRAGARAMIQQLHAMDIRPVRMLTGDNRTTAAHIARQLDIDRFDAQLLPEDKVRILEDMKREAHARNTRARGVGVIGDGVNDAPALAAADVSIAIGSIGSDAALESADIVLLNDDLTVIPWAVRLARRARAIVVFNLSLALTIIVGMAAAVLVGSLLGRQVPLPIAVLAHEGGTLLVVANSLRLLLTPAPHGVSDIDTATEDITPAEGQIPNPEPAVGVK